MLLNALNSHTTYKLSVSDDILLNQKKWNIRVKICFFED